MKFRNRRRGRIEAIKYADEVVRRRGIGESLSWIYSDLFERGEVTVSYSSFARWISRVDSGDLRRGQSAISNEGREIVGSSAISRDSPEHTTSTNGRGDTDGPAHGIVGVPRPARFNTTPNPDELY